MARMHSRKRGKSGSTKPIRKSVPVWVKYKPEEVEKLVIKLAKEGKKTSEIGIVLRDSYGIPCVKTITNKKITEVIKENKLERKIPEDLHNLIEKAVSILKHLEKNKQDMVGKRGLQLTESKIKRLTKYYKNKKRLPADWKYSRETSELLLR